MNQILMNWITVRNSYHNSDSETDDDGDCEISVPSSNLIDVYVEKDK